MDNFKKNIIAIYGKKGQIWLDNLPNLVNEIALIWGLTKLRPLNHLSYNYVLDGLCDSKEIILKISYDSQTIANETIALKALANYGAVTVLNSMDKVLLLEKLNPGISLKTYLPDRRKEALKIACDLIKKLHQAPLTNNLELPTIQKRFSLLDQNWQIANDYLSKARIFRDEILTINANPVILHGDLHHDNILQNIDGWKVIDPHGVIGYPINEVWNIIREEEDFEFVASYFNFNLQTLKKCYYAHAILSACWAVEDNGDPSFYLDLANKVKL